VASDPYNVLSPHHALYENLELKFIEDPEETIMFGPLGEDAYIFSFYKIAMNIHSWSISPSTFDTD